VHNSNSNNNNNSNSKQLIAAMVALGKEHKFDVRVFRPLKIANREARSFVQRLHPFQGANLFATYWCANPYSADSGDSGYAVFSYGVYWPLFISVHINGHDVWFENEERYSVTTSKHRSQTHPHQPTTLLSGALMRRLHCGGFKAIAKERILGSVQQTEVINKGGSYR